MTETDETKKMMDVLTEINKTRKVEMVEVNNQITLIEDGIEVFRAKKLKHCIRAEMLPDVFTYSNIKHSAVVGTIHFNGSGHLRVYLDVDVCDIGDLFDIVKDALIGLNLYGYRLTN